MAFDPDTDTGADVEAQAEQQDLQDRYDTAQAAPVSTPPSFPLRPTAPGVLSPAPAPPPQTALTPPAPTPIRPPKYKPPSDDDFVPDPNYVPRPPSKPVENGKTSGAWNDMAQAFWQGWLGQGKDIIGAAQFATDQLNADPAIKAHLQNAQDVVADQIDKSVSSMSEAGQKAMHASVLGYLGARDAQGNAVPTPGDVGLGHYLGLTAAQAVPTLLLALLPGSIVAKIAVKGMSAVGAAEGAAAVAGTIAGTGTTAGIFGGQNAGAVYNDLKETLAHTSPAEMMGSPVYADAVKNGMSDGEAKAEILKGAGLSIAAAGAVGAAAGVGVSGVLKGGALTAGRGLLARTAIGATEGGATMAAQGAANSALTQQAATGKVDLSSVLADAEASGVQGLAMGAAGGMFHPGEARAPREAEPPPPPDKPGRDPAVATALNEALQPPNPLRAAMTSQPAGFGARGTGDQGEMFQPFEHGPAVQPGAPAGAPAPERTAQPPSVSPIAVSDRTPGYQAPQLPGYAMTEQGPVIARAAPPEPGPGMPGARQGEMLPTPGAGSTQGQAEAFPPAQMGPPRAIPGAGVPEEAQQGELFPQPVPAPATSVATPATRAAITTSRGAAETPAPTGPRPSDGMKVGELRDALTTMPGQDPRAVKAMSRNDLATAYDRLAPQSTPEPKATTVVTGSEAGRAVPPANEPAAPAAAEPKGEAPPSSPPVVGSLPVAAEAGVAPGAPPAPGEPGGRALTPDEFDERLKQNISPTPKRADEPVLEGRQATVAPEAFQAPAPEKPKPVSAAAARRAAEKARMAKPGVAGEGEGAPPTPAAEVKPYVEPGEAPPSSSVDKAATASFARAERSADLAEAVRVLRAPKNLEPVLRRAQRELTDAIGRSDGSRDAVAELIHDWREKQPTAPYPGTEVTARMLADHFAEHVAGQKLADTGVETKARAEIEAVRREEAGRRGVESKTVSAEHIERMAAPAGAPEGTSIVTTGSDDRGVTEHVDRKRVSDDLIEKLLDPDDSMTVQEADQHYGKPKPGPGRPRRWAVLADRVRERIAEAHDPDGKRELAILVDQSNAESDPKLTPKEREVRTKTNERALRSVGPEAEARLTDILRQLEDPVGRAADRAKLEAEMDARIARSRGRALPIEDAPAPRPTSTGIDPRSSRYVRSASQDPRVDASYLRALRASDENGVDYTTHDFLKHVIQDPLVGNELQPYRRLSQRLLKLARNLPIKTIDRALDEGHITPEQHADMAQRGVYGAYDPNSEHILVNPDAIRGTGTHTETALHEILHSITYKYLRDLERTDRNYPNIRALEAIRRELARHLDEANARGELSDAERQRLAYALSNIHELHTQLMTDPIVQGFAASRQASPELRSRLAQLGFAPREQGRSVWSHFTDWVRKALGLQAPASASEYTMLDHLLRPVTDITDRAAEYNKRFLPKDPMLYDRAEPMYDGAYNAMSQRTRDFVDRVDPRGVGDRLRRVLLSAMTSDAMVARYRNILPGLDNWRASYEGIARVGKQFSDKYSDRVRDLGRRYNQVNDKQALGHLMTDATLGEAHLGPGLAADANAHLTTPEQLSALRDLQDRYDRLSPDAKALYGEMRDTYSEWYKQQRTAELSALMRGYMPDATDAQREAFAKAATSKKFLDAFISDPDHSDIAKAFSSDDWRDNRAIAKGIAQVHAKGFVQGDYFPLRRFGDYVVRYGSAADPDHYGVEMFERRSDAEARRAELVRNGVEMVHQVASRRDSDLRDLVPNHPAVDELAASLAKRGYSDAETKEVRDTLNSILLQHATHAEATKARMRRRGVKGAATDQGRVLASEFVNNVVRMGHLEYGLARSKALTLMRDQVTALEHPDAPPGQAITAGSVLNEAQKKSTAIDADNVLSSIAAKANSFSFAQSLMSPSHMLTSSLEAHSNSMAYLGARFGAGRASLALSRALLQASPVLGKGVSNTLNAVRGELKASDWNLSHMIRDRMVARGSNKTGIAQLFRSLEDAGLIDHTMLQDLRRQANPTGAVRTRVGEVWNRFQNFSAASAHAVDVMNKSAIAKAAFDLEYQRLAREPISAAERTNRAVDYATEIARKAMPNYNTGNKARMASARGVLGPLGAPLFQFKNYGLHELSIIANLARESMSGPGKWEARKAFAGILATRAMMAGVITLIADPLRYIGGGYDFITGAAKPHDYQSDVRGFMDEVFGKEAGELISRGLPHALGIDIHNRVGLANLLEIPEMSSFDAEGAGQVLLGLATGATGENLANDWGGLTRIMQGHPLDGLQAMLPRPIRDVMKGVDLQQQGVTTQRGRVLVPPDQVSTGAVAARMLGFQPSMVSEAREGSAAVQQARDEALAEHQRLTQAYLKADPGQRQNVWQEIQLFNQDPRHTRITRQQLLLDEQRARKQAGAVGSFGLRLPRRTAAQLEQAGAFANYQ